MFRVEIPDSKVESITIAGCIGGLSMNKEDGQKFAKKYNLTLKQPLNNKVDVIFVLDGPANKENLEKFFERFEEEDFDEELKEDLISAFVNFPKTNPFEYLIHLIKDYIYFYDREGIIKDGHLLEGVMPVYHDFIKMVEEKGLFWTDEITQFKNEEIETVKILKALNNSQAHCEEILKPIVDLLEERPEKLNQEFISTLKVYLSKVVKTPYPDFSFYSPLQKELAKKTLPSNEELNDLYSTISEVVQALEPEFNFQSPKKWKEKTDSNQESFYKIIPTKFMIEFRKFYRSNGGLSPMSLMNSPLVSANSPQKENGSSQIYRGYSPKIDWKTRTITSPAIKKVQKKLDFSDQELQKQKPMSTPKPKHKPKSCLSAEQIERIKAHEDLLNKEIDNGSFFYESRKKQKAEGLKKLVDYSYESESIVDLIDRVETEFPNLRAGFFSRTGNILDELLESEGIVSCCC